MQQQQQFFWVFEEGFMPKGRTEGGGMPLFKNILKQPKKTRSNDNKTEEIA